MAARSGARNPPLRLLQPHHEQPARVALLAGHELRPNQEPVRLVSVSQASQESGPIQRAGQPQRLVPDVLGALHRGPEPPGGLLERVALGGEGAADAGLHDVRGARRPGVPRVSDAPGGCPDEGLRLARKDRLINLGLPRRAVSPPALEPREEASDPVDRAGRRGLSRTFGQRRAQLEVLQDVQHRRHIRQDPGEQAIVVTNAEPAAQGRGDLRAALAPLQRGLRIMELAVGLDEGLHLSLRPACAQSAARPRSLDAVVGAAASFGRQAGLVEIIERGVHRVGRETPGRHQRAIGVDVQGLMDSRGQQGGLVHGPQLGQTDERPGGRLPRLERAA